MKTEEINLILNEQNYLFRLTPKKIKKRGGKKNNITLTMILNEADEYIKKTGKLKARIFAGENLKDWQEVGTFTEEYMNNPIQDYGKKSLDLNMGNIKIEIDEYFESNGTYNASAVIRKRNHWYEKWKDTPVEKVIIKEIRLDPNLKGRLSERNR